ncbi:MAG TPA: NADH/ubiquinone/plastoquinone (complex I) [Candidatus Omnitrophica bacterium]|nr:MAG: NADH/ubiquinone/plastoquinone (complex I) [Candidatus Omnitrophota bacterium]HEC69974.1 NADH/ubiquinone/plastoquinone (complex I) [Candidatus Omnitrophota bacterium]
MSQLIPLFIVLPLLGAFLNSLFVRKNTKVSDILSLLITFSLSVISFLSLFLVNKYGVLIYKVGGWRPPLGITLVLDGLSSLLLLTVCLVSFFISLYSINYMEKYTSKEKFYTLFLLMLAGMNGVVATGDLFNLFVFLELASVASYALVAFGTEKEELEASFKYAIMSSVASLFILLGIGIIYSFTSTLNMADIAKTLGGSLNKVVVFAGILFFMGFGLKASIVPFHAWLPDAHPSAPAPISASLSGLLIKSLGIYSLVRVIYNVLGLKELFSLPLMFLGTVSIMVGVVLAIGQWDFKRLLAYHSISQVGYIILGIGLGTPLGILGGLFHLFNHSLFKSLLFLNSGAVEYSTGSRQLLKIKDLGLRSKMPFTSLTTLIASLSISGIPPFNGFFSKLIVIFSCIKAGFFGYAFWAIVGSILTLASFMKVYRYSFSTEHTENREIKEVPFFMKLAMLSLSLLCILSSFLFLNKFSNFFLGPAQKTLLEAKNYSTINDFVENVR